MYLSVSGLQETKNALATLAGQLPFATSLALNRMGKETLAAQKQEMRSKFDRPTPYTLDAQQVRPSDTLHPRRVV